MPNHDLNPVNLLLVMVMYILLLLLVAYIVQFSFNNVIPHMTQNSLKIPKLNFSHSLSLLILTSVLVKTSCVCVNNGQL